MVSGAGHLELITGGRRFLKDNNSDRKGFFRTHPESWAVVIWWLSVAKAGCHRREKKDLGRRLSQLTATRVRGGVCRIAWCHVHRSKMGHSGWIDTLISFLFSSIREIHVNSGLSHGRENKVSCCLEGISKGAHCRHTGLNIKDLQVWHLIW